MKIATPELKVARFGTEDVIATSGYYIPSSQYYESSFSEPFVHFRGEMGFYDDAAQGWRIFVESGATGTTAESLDGTINEIRNASHSTAYALCNNLYDAYQYNGYYYTKGASYYELYGNQ